YKMEAGRFELHAAPVKLAEVLQRLLDISRSAFDHRQLSLKLEGADDNPPLVLGDAMLCHSLFQNLVKNACEAAPEGGTVTVRLLPGNPVQVQIHNPGAVPVEVREHFFDKFVTHGKQGGTGLG